MSLVRWAALAAVAFWSAASHSAEASWHRASSKHFVIYSQQPPDELRAYAEQLERFDAAVRFIRKMKDYPVGDGNRVTIFVVPDQAVVRQLAGDKSNFLSGFYIGKAEGSIALVPQRMKDSSESGLSGGTVLFHEYAHHLLAQDLNTPYPEWLVEGFAEFLATARFERDGGVGLGLIPQHRAYGLVEGKSLPWPTILGGNYGTLTNDQRESIYGRGWLLTHFLIFQPARKGQLDSYLKAIAKGTPAAEAARLAFGDLDQLGRELSAYMRDKRLKFLNIPGHMLPTARVELSALSAGASAVLPLRWELKKGVDKARRPILLEQIRKVAAAYPGDPLVETTLAEAALATDLATAEAAADRALKSNPRDIEAMILKGKATTQRLTESPSATDDDFAAARKWFLDANKLDPDDPEPLMEFFMSFFSAGVRPTANAIAALHYASNLAPQDVGLRMNSALQYIRDGKLKEARAMLAPVAYSPHAEQAAAAAKRMIASIDAGDAKGAERVGLQD